MSNPENNDNAAATQTANKSEQEELTPEQKMEIAEKRRRDTQAAYTKGQQELQKLKAEKEALEKLLKPTIHITEDEQAELEDLKFSDPDAWRQKMNEIESRAKTEMQNKVQETLTQVGEEASGQYEVERRKQVLEDFNASAKIAITDELIADEVPPRITKKLEAGTISFEDFLKEVEEYVTTGKVVKDETTLNQTNLNELGGSSTPSEAKAGESLQDAYAEDTY